MVNDEWRLDSGLPPVTDHQSRSMRLEPILADAHLHRNGHVQRNGGLHPLFDQRQDLLLLGLVEVEHQFVVDLEQHAGAQLPAAPVRDGC